MNLIKKAGISVLATMMMVSMLVTTPFVKIRALDQGGSIIVEQNDDTLTIGNDYLSREFSMVGDKLSTTKLVNKRTSPSETLIIPGEGSEEFIIKRTKKIFTGIDRKGWDAVADSYQNASGASDGPASNLLDGDTGSIWHTKYNNNGAAGDTSLPFAVYFNMNKVETFKSFAYTPRQNGVETNGNISQYALYAANSEEVLDYATDDAGVPTNAAWTLISSGTFTYNDVNPIYVDLAQEETANQLMFVALSAVNGKQFAGGAEFNLYEETADEVKAILENEESGVKTFAASEFTLSDVEVSDTTATINDVEKVGKKVTFSFEPFEFNGVTYTVKENVVMYEGDYFMRKYLEISVPQEQALLAEIDYIDLESIVIDESYQQWTIPRGYGEFGGYYSEFIGNLGQPIYVQGMFMGCEFPATNTEIIDHVGFMRYYTGKTFDRLVKDNQAGIVDGNVVYNTWQTVYGAARSTEQDVIQADFFDYIYSIATPSEFRIQYNSWFDNMMFISEENILDTFIEFDRELSRAEVRPLDSYVMDDGWINYNKTVPTDAIKIRRSGSTVNQSGFWEFNEKFPNGLSTVSSLANKFGSNYGIWVGPRGGYNYYGELADIMVEAGTGSKAGGSIDVADRTYIENFKNMALDWQTRYGVNYWKWDGFANKAQFNAFGATDGVAGYSESNRHMIGGFEHMYHVTDLWEGWIDLMEVLRENEIEYDVQKLWISLTCYVIPSPWFLQWVNSVWIQYCADQADAGPSTSKMDKQMTYRDGIYYEFYRERQFQFPPKNLYNHDPIYGVEGTGMNINTATTEQFQNYLYMQSTRGIMFWELLFSDSIMTEEKYAVTSDFLEWAERNQDILAKSKMFGGDPTSSNFDTYGYACFDGTDGIIAVRNPGNTTKDITFVYDRNIGVPENTNGKYHIEHCYKYSGNEEKTGEFVYGETYTISLQPDEVRMFMISEDGDTEAPTIERAYTDGNNKITVKFNEKVTGNSFKVNGVPVLANVNDDDISFTIKRQNVIPAGEVVIEALNVKDLAGNACVDNIVTTIQTIDKIVAETDVAEFSGTKVLADAENSIRTDMGFSVRADVKTTSTTPLVSQGSDYVLGINEEGYAYFSVNGTTAVSSTIVNDGAEHALVGVLENNGMAKIYVDGNIDGAKYNAENQFARTQGAEIVLGDASFSGSIGAKVSDEAFGYDNLDLSYAEEEGEVVGRTPLDSTNFQIEVTGIDTKYNPYDPAADPTIIFDDSDTTYWTSNVTTGGLNSNTNMVINLNGKYKLDRLDYTKRYDSSQIFKCTGNLRDIVVEVSDDGQEWTQVAAQPTFDDENYTAKNDGGTTIVEFTETEASYVRIWANDSYFWKEDGTKYMTVAGLKLYGEVLEQDDVNIERNLALRKTNLTARYKNGASMENINSNRPLSNAVDGVKNSTDNYADMGSDSDVAGTTSAYFQVDLEDVYSISKINLYRYWFDNRIYTNSVIAISKTEDFSNAYVVYNTDVNNIHGFGVGTDEGYQETSAGKSWTFDETLGRYVRVYMSGSTSGNTMHIVELEVYGKEYEEVLDITPLTDKIAEAEAIQADAYTSTTYANLQKVLADARLAVNNVETNDEVALVVATLQAAIDDLDVFGTFTTVNAEVVDYKTIKLNFEAVDATSYVVERLNTTTNEWMVVGETTETEYVCAGVKTGKAYTYRVKALKGETAGAYSEELVVTPTLSGEVELTLTMNGTNKFDLSWTKVDGATRYIIYRKASNGEYKKIVTLGKDATTYTSKVMKPDTYTYQVKAARYDSVDRVMTGGSNEVSGTIESLDTTTLTVTKASDNSVNVSWTKLEGMGYYELYRATNGGTYRLLTRTPNTAYVSTSLKQGNTYSYKVRGCMGVDELKVTTPFSAEVTYTVE